MEPKKSKQKKKAAVKKAKVYLKRAKKEPHIMGKGKERRGRKRAARQGVREAKRKSY